VDELYVNVLLSLESSHNNPPDIDLAVHDVVVTDVDADDAEDVPLVFVAVTVNVYAVPSVNPETVIGDDVPVPVNPPGELVTV
jgi:hypothetical protein